MTAPTEVRCFTDLEQGLERLRLFALRVEETTYDSSLSATGKLGVIRALLWRVKHGATE